MSSYSCGGTSVALGSRKQNFMTMGAICRGFYLHEWTRTNATPGGGEAEVAV
jgi:hypothetical protein